MAVPPGHGSQQFVDDAQVRVMARDVRATASSAASSNCDRDCVGFLRVPEDLRGQNARDGARMRRDRARCVVG